MSARLVPALLGAALLLVPAVVPLWNSAADMIGHREWGIRIKPLGGVHVELPRPTLTLASLWDGQFERATSTRFGQQLFVLPWAVRAKSWLYYHLLHASTVETVMVGRRRTLYEDSYLSEYCSRDLSKFVPRAEDWAGKLRAIQDYYQTRGRAFLYLITPSKAAVYPDRLPDFLACAGHEHDKRDLLPTYERILAAKGVHYVDAAADVAAARPQYAIGVFPRSGTHWNAVGTAIGLQALIAALNRHDPDHHIDEWSFTWGPVPATGADIDLLMLLNVTPGSHDVAPQVTLGVTTASPSCHPPKLTIVGGSFNWMLLNMIRTAPCKPEITFWYYFRRLYAHFLADGVLTGPIPLTPELEAQRDRDLLDGDGDVILEENESDAGTSDHGKAVYDLLKPHLPPSG